MIAANFAGISQEIVTGVPAPGRYKEIFNSDDARYGGTGIVNSRVKRSRQVETDDRPDSISVKLAPLSLSILKYTPYTQEELALEKEKSREKKKNAQPLSRRGQAQKERK